MNQFKERWRSTLLQIYPSTEKTGLINGNRNRKRQKEAVGVAAKTSLTAKHSLDKSSCNRWFGGLELAICGKIAGIWASFGTTSKTKGYILDGESLK